MIGLVKNGNVELGKTICSMIKNGVNPQNEHYWGLLGDYAHKIVDMPAIAFFLFINQDLLEEEFYEKEKQLLANWFIQVNTVKVWDNNWHFFLLLVNAILIQLNLGGSYDIIQDHWKSLDRFYLTDGWYADGQSNQRDYYVAWGFHFYSMLWMYIDKAMPKDIREVIVTRAEEFAKSFKHFFACTGEAVPFGRSLIYRFAQVAFWSAYKLVGLNGQDDAMVKGIITRNMSWWLEKDILRQDGTLSIGYTYDNMLVADVYSAEGSPYWAFTSFLLLLIPDRSPFWSAQAGTANQDNKEMYIPGSGLHISYHDGMVALYPINHKPNNAWPNGVSVYQKFVYSTGFGFCFEHGFVKRELAGSDSSIAISIEDGPWIARNNATKWEIHEGNVISSLWSQTPG